MARRATKIREIRESSQKPMLLLDAGGTLFGETVALKSEGRVLVEAMNAMGYDAMTVGEMDLAKGVDVLLARAQEAQFPLLSSNLVGAKDQQLLFAPYTIVERQGVRFGILGVTEPDVVNAPGVREVVQVRDPVEAVGQYLPEVRAKSDVVILLSHLGFEEDAALAAEVRGINVIIGGRTRKVVNVPDRVGRTVITQAGFDGEWLGHVELLLDEQGNVLDIVPEMIVLGPEIADDPELAALVERYKEQFPEPTPTATKP